jgi:hypothetical protein
MAMDTSGIDRFGQAVARSVRDHWVLFLIEGIVLVVLGVLAIVVPMVATIAVTILIGWLFLISGVVGLITTLRMHPVEELPMTRRRQRMIGDMQVRNLAPHRQRAYPWCSSHRDHRADPRASVAWSDQARAGSHWRDDRYC